MNLMKSKKKAYIRKTENREMMVKTLTMRKEKREAEVLKEKERGRGVEKGTTPAGIVVEVVNVSEDGPEVEVKKEHMEVLEDILTVMRPKMIEEMVIGTKGAAENADQIQEIKETTEGAI